MATNSKQIAYELRIKTAKAIGEVKKGVKAFEEGEKRITQTHKTNNDMRKKREEFALKQRQDRIKQGYAWELQQARLAATRRNQILKQQNDRAMLIMKLNAGMYSGRGGKSSAGSASAMEIVSVHAAEHAKGFGNAVTGVGRSINSFASHLAMLGVGMTYIISHPLMNLSGSVLKLGMDAEETQNKFDAVFRNVRKGANDTARSLSKSLGETSATIQESMSGMGGTLKSYGMSDAGALSMSSVLMQRAADITSFRNAPSTKDTADAIRKYLAGEQETLQTLVGQSFTQEQYQGGISRYKSMGMTDIAAKSLARIDYLFKATSDDAGDLARTWNSLANVTRRMKAAFDELKATMGKAIEKQLNFSVMLNQFTEIFQTLSNAASNAPAEFWKGVTKFVSIAIVTGPVFIAMAASLGAIGLAFRSLGAVFAGLLPVVRGLIYFLKLNPVTRAVSIGLASVGTVIGADIGDTLWKSWNVNKGAIKQFGDSMSGTAAAIQGIGNMLFDTFTIIYDYISTISQFATIASSTLDTLKTAFENVYGFSAIKKGLSEAASWIWNKAGPSVNNMLGIKEKDNKVPLAQQKFNAAMDTLVNKLKMMERPKGGLPNIFPSYPIAPPREESLAQSQKGPNFAPAALYGSAEAYSIIMGTKADAANETAKNTAEMVKMMKQQEQPKFAPANNAADAYNLLRIADMGMRPLAYM